MVAEVMGLMRVVLTVTVTASWAARDGMPRQSEHHHQAAAPPSPGAESSAAPTQSMPLSHVYSDGELMWSWDTGTG